MSSIPHFADSATLFALLGFVCQEEANNTFPKNCPGSTHTLTFHKSSDSLPNTADNSSHTLYSFFFLASSYSALFSLFLLASI